MNWPIWLFVLVLVGLMVGWYMTRSLLFAPLTALVVYLAVDFSVVDREHPALWDVVRVGFWILMILAVIAFVISRFGLLFMAGALALAGLIMTSVVAAAYYHDWLEENGEDDVEVADAPATTTTTTEPTPEEDARECPDTWMIVQADNERNRWFADGLREIEDADTEEEAREAAETWLRLVRRDPQLLAGAAAYLTDRQVEWGSLTTEDGKCASEVAETLTAEIELAIAQAEVTPEDAPADGVNSGVNGDGNVVAASYNGITGNRAAVKVETKDGKTVWLMARCGNPVVQGPPPVPEGPTDQPPPPTTTAPPTTPPTSPPTTGLAPKDPDKSVNNNPEVPDQVRKTKPSPDNQTEAEKDPVTPTDSPTGCDGSCSDDPSFDDPPETTTTTRPPSTSTTTVPSCGQAGQPSCDNTGVNPPPTTQPPAPPPEDDPNDGTVVSP